MRDLPDQREVRIGQSMTAKRQTIADRDWHGNRPTLQVFMPTLPESPAKVQRNLRRRISKMYKLQRPVGDRPYRQHMGVAMRRGAVSMAPSSPSVSDSAWAK